MACVAMDKSMEEQSAQSMDKKQKKKNGRGG